VSSGGGLIVGLAFVVAVLLVPWWQGPSAEVEVAKYFEEASGRHQVRVVDCSYVEDPEGSVNDR